MTRKQARRILNQIEEALRSEKPMTNVTVVLGMNPDWFDTAQDWQDAVTVRIADLRKVAGL